MFVYILELLENNLLQDSTFSKLITATDEKLGKINKLFESLINLERKERPKNKKQIRTFVRINKEIQRRKNRLHKKKYLAQLINPPNLSNDFKKDDKIEEAHHEPNPNLKSNPSPCECSVFSNINNSKDCFDFDISEDDIISTYTSKQNNFIKYFMYDFDINNKMYNNTSNSSIQDQNSIVSFLDEVKYN